LLNFRFISIRSAVSARRTDRQTDTQTDRQAQRQASQVRRTQSYVCWELRSVILFYPSEFRLWNYS